MNEWSKKQTIADNLNEEFGIDNYLSESGAEIARSGIADHGVLITNADDEIVFANERLALLIDVPPEFLQPKRPRRDMIEYRALRGDYGPNAVEYLDKVVAVFGPGCQVTLESATPSGQMICANGVPLPDGGSIITYTDITRVHDVAAEIIDRRRELQQAQKENQALVNNLQDVVENIEYGIVFLDQDMNAVLINRAFRKMWDKDEALCDSRPHMRDLMAADRYKGLYDVADEDFDEYIDARLEAMRRGDTEELELRHRNGRTVIHRCITLPDGRRMLTYFDISDIKAREKEIRRQAEALQVIQDSIGHGLSWIDKDLRLQAWNTKCVELLGLEDCGVEIGDPIEKIFRFNALRGEYGDGDPEEKVAQRLELTKKLEPHVFERVRDDGTILRIEGYPVSEGGFVTVLYRCHGIPPKSETDRIYGALRCANRIG